MSRATSLVVAFLVLLAGVAPVAADESKAPPAPADELPVAPSGPPEVVPGEVVVKWRDAATGRAQAHARGLGVVADLPDLGKGAPLLVTTMSRNAQDVLAELRSDPAVEYAEPNYVVQLADEGSVAAVAVNDPKTGTQYALSQMRVRDAWSLSTGASNLVAVLDTGVQANHPDLVGRVVAGYDFVNGDSNAADDNGHGTWAAGIIAANANDGYGMAGISWSDKILPVKTMNAVGTGTTSNLTSGIVWAANKGAKVINMSVGGFPYSQYVQDAVNYAWSKGAVLIGAAGNNNRDERFYPASYANVVSVSATQANDEFSYWSSYGPAVDVSAPGSSVLATNCTAASCPHPDWGSHAQVSGTSFATPNVAGVVALIRARYPAYTPAQVVDRLFSTVDDRGYAGWDKRYGRGRVNAYRALGGTPPAAGLDAGDGFEPNNTLAAAKTIGLGVAARPSLHAAGDADWFAVNVPRAGRLDVRVTGVVDNRAWPWHGSSLKVDPIVELYSTTGTLLKRVDAVWETGTELAQMSVTAPTRILVRVTNYFANGNRIAYSVTPAFVDTVAPKLVDRRPTPDAVNVSYDGASIGGGFDEPVTGVGAGTVQLKNSAGAVVATTVSYSSSTRRVTIQPSAPLAPEARYSVHFSSGIKDSAGNAFGGSSWAFTTGKSVPRLAGADRYATAAAISRSAFAPGVPIVYIATGASYPDALAGGPAASVGNGPLMLTTRDSLPAATAAELIRLKPARIVILGGTGVVSKSVETALNSYTAGGVTRIAGADRYATAAATSAAAFPAGASVVYVATGSTFPDALAAGAIAAGAKVPILLVGPNALPSATAVELERLGPDKIIVMGGTSMVSDAVLQQLKSHAATVVRVAGTDRYDNAVKLSASTFGANGVGTVYVASGDSFPDGLAAGPVAGRNRSPLLLVPPNFLPATVAAELKRLDPTRVVMVGGSAVISDTVRNQIRAVWP